MIYHHAGCYSLQFIYISKIDEKTINRSTLHLIYLIHNEKNPNFPNHRTLSKKEENISRSSRPSLMERIQFVYKKKKKKKIPRYLSITTQNDIHNTLCEWGKMAILVAIVVVDFTTKIMFFVICLVVLLLLIV